MLEREVKLAVPPSFSLPDLGDLGAAIHTSPVDERRLETVYYDSPDLRLTRWGCSLRLRQGEGWTLKLPVSGDHVALTRRELEFPNRESRPPDAAVALVLGYVRKSTLVPVVSLSTLRRKLQLLTGDGTVLAEVVDDDVSVIQGLRVQNRFREIEVELRDPSAEALLQPILSRLRGAGAADEGQTSKLIRALGARATAPPEVDPLPIGSAPTTAELVRHVIGSSVSSLLQHDPGVRLGDDPEDVHRARVATRRLRSQLRTFRTVLEPDWTATIREDLRWLGGGLGTVRDKQVLSQRLRGRAAALDKADAPAVAELADELEAESQEARGRLVLDMRSERYLEIIERLIEASRSPRVTDAGQQPASSLMSSLVRRDWKRLRKGVSKLPEVPSDAELHRIRIMAKRLRYAAEAAEPIAGKDATRQAEAATQLQDVLGDHQDSVTAQRWLRQATQGPQAFAAGELTAMERAAALEDRVEWHRAWKKLSRRRLRKWMI
ncbi:MAG TPA: CYTH and CHAD domain-containing protein [Candidatus Dormibacteraeota bacterium]|jgi:CHAD domain-containing protein|nr:CYTH and CHAD domain-containing protein [Candidatus Dormibacteraeota bacterium]